jgi:hypothetical protein
MVGVWIAKKTLGAVIAFSEFSNKRNFAVVVACSPITHVCNRLKAIVNSGSQNWSTLGISFSKSGL